MLPLSTSQYSRIITRRPRTRAIPNSNSESTADATAVAVDDTEKVLHPVPMIREEMIIVLIRVQDPESGANANADGSIVIEW